jgi:hypothetical protein
MRKSLALLAVILAAGLSLSHFKYRRTVQAPASGGPHYFAVDDEQSYPDEPDPNVCQEES